MKQATLVPADDGRADTEATPLVLKPSFEVTWAVICGCVASGALREDGLTVLRILATWLVADATVGCVLAQLITLKRASLAYASLPLRVIPFFRVIVPYAAQGSPGYRLAESVNDHIARWREQIWPHAGRCGMTALVGTGLALVVATYLGRTMLAAVSGALLLAALLTVLAGHSEVALERWLKGLHLALAWALGHLALAPWRGPSLGLATLVGLYVYARERSRAEDSRLARALLTVIWAILVFVLLAARQPILAAAVACACSLDVAASMESREGGVSSDERLASGGLGEADGHRVGGHPVWRGLHARRLGWLLTMLLAALAVTHWS